MDCAQDEEKKIIKSVVYYLKYYIPTPKILNDIIAKKMQTY